MSGRHGKGRGVGVGPKGTPGGGGNRVEGVGRTTLTSTRAGWASVQRRVVGSHETPVSPFGHWPQTETDGTREVAVLRDLRLTNPNRVCVTRDSRELETKYCQKGGP